MEVKINIKEIAEAIATEVEQVTGVDCEAFANETGAVVVYRCTKLIARITPLFGAVYVAPVGGVFDDEPVEMPIEARTVNGLKEIAAALDEANIRVISAAAKL